MKALYLSGLLIPILYMSLYLIGGALRSDYSHIKDSVSELLTADAPNKRLLLLIQIIYALLHIVFGYSIQMFMREGSHNSMIGSMGAWMIVALGIITLGTAIFPQDKAGSKQTLSGQLHKIMVFGGLIPISIISILCFGVWAKQADLASGFDIYSFITVGATIFIGILGGLTINTRFAGIVERIAAGVIHQWLFVLAVAIYLY